MLLELRNGVNKTLESLGNGKIPAQIIIKNKKYHNQEYINNHLYNQETIIIDTVDIAKQTLLHSKALAVIKEDMKRTCELDRDFIKPTNAGFTDITWKYCWYLELWMKEASNS